MLADIRHSLNGSSLIKSILRIFLLGFKPISTLHRHYHLRPAQFLYPDESNATGSTIWFSTLLIACLRRQLVAISLYTQRRHTAPRLVALLPQVNGFFR
ncbi:unnamed protein product [Protopolystoma xenopodis]|uniref:Ku domain-containing protein n=1 Tax=Protopolystoma xenopodis TaxID=117903 RepID=A0A3S5BRW0_9PLAT|nr:unnamed protein product [Protopolystoma xenopodis]